MSVNYFIKTLDEYHNLIENSKNVVVQCSKSSDFQSDYSCAEFNMYAPEFSDVSIAHLDVEDSKELATSLGITETPLYIFIRDGVIAGRYCGHRKEEILERLSLLSGGDALPVSEQDRVFSLPSCPVDSAVEMPSIPRPLKLFVAGDRSKVGKSSVCLGLLGTFLRMGYTPQNLAYIKPATQCELPQLVTRWCEKKGIANQGIGPVVFHKGFTREFLRGNVGTSKHLLDEIENSVTNISKGKQLVLIDGVGYPAVGSICGVSNADIAARLKVPVVIVGPKGVGHAVDSFNLNACFFERDGSRVLGAIFNRISNDPNDYYSLEKTKEAVDSYFRQYRPSQRVYGYIPEIQGLGEARATSENESKESQHEDLISLAETFIDIFNNNVAITTLLDDLKALDTSDQVAMQQHQPHDPASIETLANTPAVVLTRAEIEEAARAQGAVASACNPFQT